jgi:uncharacterized Zn-binding protein involved in type VI secretion
MPGLILHLGATITCSHAGQATPAASMPRVLVSGQPVVVAGTPYVIAGCPLPPPIAANGPCVTGQFTTPATRVLVNGMPVLINASPSLCAPTGTPLIPAIVQTRVVAT